MCSLSGEGICHCCRRPGVPVSLELTLSTPSLHVHYLVIIMIITLKGAISSSSSRSFHVTWFALHFHCAPLAQCIRLRRWFSSILSEFPSCRRSADQGWRASSALVFISQGFPSLRLEAITRLLTAWWSRRRTPRGFPLGMTVPPANLPRPGGIIASWSGTAYSTRQVWLISQLTSISEGLSPIRHPGTRLVGDGRPTTELEVAYSRKGAIWDFLQFPHCAVNCLQKGTIVCKSRATHRVLVMCSMSRAT